MQQVLSLDVCKFRLMSLSLEITRIVLGSCESRNVNGVLKEGSCCKSTSLKRENHAVSFYHKLIRLREDLISLL
jgi:hypothetical protein